MRRHITVHGWSTGLVDPMFADRVDTEAVNSSLQECENFIIEGSGAAATRPQLKSVTGWVDWGTTVAAGGVSYSSGIDLFPFNFNGTSYAVVTNAGRSDGIWRWRANGTADFKGTIGSSFTGKMCMAQVGKACYFARSGLTAYYSPDMTTSSNDTAQVQFYKEISGTVETCKVLQVKITAPLVAGVPESIPVVGDVIYKQTGDVPIGVARRVRMNVGTSAAASSLWEYEIVVGSFGTMPDVTDEITFSVSDCIGEVTAVDSSVQIFGTGTFFNSEFDNGDEIRIGGTEYTIATVTDDNLLDMTDTISDRFEGVRAASRMTALPYFSAVGAYQGRMVWAGNSRSAVGSLVGSESSLCFSSSYDPLVIAAAPQVIPDAASPFFITVTTSAAAVQWVVGGDSLFFGTYNGEYAVDPGPIGATPELLPRIRLMGNYGSSSTTPVAPFDGRIIFAPRSGGDIIAMEYIDTKARFEGKLLNPLCPSLITGGANSIAVRPRSDTDTSQKIFVLDSPNTANGLRIGSIQYGSDAVAWSNISFDADEVASPIATFWQVVEFDKDVYIVLKYNTDNFGMFKLNYDAASSNGLSGMALDFATACTNTSGFSYQVNSDASTGGMRTFFASKQVAVIGTYAATGRAFYGIVTLNSSSIFTANIALSSVIVGLPVYARMVPARVMVEDEEGSSLGRRIRLVSVSPSVLNTRQLIMNNTGVIPDRVDGYENPLKTDHIKRYYMGWLRDRDIEIEAAPGYSATIKSLTYEVSV